MLKNRPNVYPWATNESSINPVYNHDRQVSSILLSSDDESLETTIPNDLPNSTGVFNTEVEIDLVEYETSTSNVSSSSNKTNYYSSNQ